MVAVGVVPWEQMIQQPLSVAVKAYMPSWVQLFRIGGALLQCLQRYWLSSWTLAVLSGSG